MSAENINQEKINLEKKEWKTPEIIELDVSSETENAGGAGPSAPDMGPAFADYNS